jgi:hypothetical protein
MSDDPTLEERLRRLGSDLEDEYAMEVYARAAWKIARLQDVSADMELQRDTLASALRLILPLAKGYAAANPVGSNERYVIEAELLLGGFDISNSHLHDAMQEARDEFEGRMP